MLLLVPMPGGLGRAKVKQYGKLAASVNHFTKIFEGGHPFSGLASVFLILFPRLLVHLLVSLILSRLLFIP